MLKAIAVSTKAKIVNSVPWTNTYGLARTLIALAIGLLLIVNPSYYLFDLVPGGNFKVHSSDDILSTINFFYWFPDYLEFVQKIAGFSLLFIATGIYPKFTGILHWWITFCFFSAATTVNGGDQLATILTLLLIPITLTDPRKSHWHALDPNLKFSSYRVMYGWLSVYLIRFQVFLVYLHAFTGKLRVTEWLDGTIMYYWINDPVFGTAWPLKGIINPLFLNGTFNALVTWSVLAVEFFLAAALISQKKYKPIIFCAAVLLHALTIFVHGLPSFAMVMFSALILYLLPVENQISFALKSVNNITEHLKQKVRHEA